MKKYLAQIVMPKVDSHKGENGRVLVIGGSKLFHAASFWSACMASKIVDMVHFSSPAMENNELMRVRAKAKFWEGIVVPWEEVSHYIEEDDCVLIGVGMERGENTREIVNTLLKKYPDKRWVVDGGALQEVDASLLNKNMIITPNKRELGILLHHYTIESLNHLGITVLSKGQVDRVSGRQYLADGSWQDETIEIKGGSAGMTKGGTGDVLAGIVAGLYAKSPAFASCIVGSQVNKSAGEELEKKMGVFFSASDLMREVQKGLGEILLR